METRTMEEKCRRGKEKAGSVRAAETDLGEKNIHTVYVTHRYIQMKKEKKKGGQKPGVGPVCGKQKAPSGKTEQFGGRKSVSRAQKKRKEKSRDE